MALPKVEYFQHAGRQAAGRPSWSFKADGVPCGRWFAEQRYAERCVGRLTAGRHDAIGGLTADPKKVRVKVTRAEGKTVMSKPKLEGKEPQPRQEPDTWAYTLDGVPHAESFPTEQDARANAAWRAFMSEGKLGLVQEATEAVREHAKDDKATVVFDGYNLVGTAGKRVFHVGVAAGKVEKVTELTGR